MESPQIQSKKKLPLWAVIVAIVAIIAIIAVIFITVSGNSLARKAEKKLTLAERYMTELKYDEAIALYNEVLEIEPKSAEAYKGLFDAYIAIGDDAKAQEILDKAKDILTADELAGMKSAFEEKFGGAKESENETIKEEDPGTSFGLCTKELYFNADGSSDGWTEIDYNSDGNMYKRTMYNADGSSDGWSEIGYNSDGNIHKKTTYNADGNVTSEDEYDEYGNIIKDLDYYDGDEYVSYCTYNSNGKLLKKIVYEHGEKTHEVEYEYDATGKRIKDTEYGSYISTDENGNTGRVSYTSWGEYQYSDGGRKATVIDHFDDGHVSAHDEEYDENGRLLFYYSDNAGWYEHGYDSEGNEIKNMYFYEGVVSHGYEYIFNDNGDYAELISYSNGTQSRTTYKYEYDSAGNKTKCTEYDSDGNITGWIEYVYD